MAFQSSGTMNLIQLVLPRYPQHDTFGLTCEKSSSGPVISEIAPGSPAYDSQLRVGDILLEVNQKDSYYLGFNSVHSAILVSDASLELVVARLLCQTPAPSTGASEDCLQYLEHRLQVRNFSFFLCR
jgi:hypothetical protein